MLALNPKVLGAKPLSDNFGSMVMQGTDLCLAMQSPKFSVRCSSPPQGPEFDSGDVIMLKCLHNNPRKIKKGTRLSSVTGVCKLKLVTGNGNIHKI